VDYVYERIKMQTASEIPGNSKKPLKVMQTKFGKDKGNCLTACVSCLTGIPIEEIPDLYSHSGLEWWDTLYDWCVKNNYGLIYFKQKDIPALILNGYGIGTFTVKGTDELHCVILEYKLGMRGNVALGEEWNHDAFVYHDPNPLKPELIDLQFHIFIIPNQAIDLIAPKRLGVVICREKLAHIIGCSSLATNALAECHHQTNSQFKIDRWMNADLEELADAIILASKDKDLVKIVCTEE